MGKQKLGRQKQQKKAANVERLKISPPVVPSGNVDSSKA
jgi:hypothetical protein